MSDERLLHTIESPADLRRLPEEKVEQVADEIRQEILERVSKTGGHLASSLGAVELITATDARIRRQVTEGAERPNGVLELPHVAWPRSCSQLSQQIVREHADTFVLCERSGEQRNVVPPLAKRWNIESHYSEPKKQIFAEAPVRHRLRERAVGGGDDPHLDVFGSVGAEWRYVASFEHA